MNPSTRPDAQSESPVRPELPARARARALLGDLPAAVLSEFHNSLFDKLCTARDEHPRAQALQVLRSLAQHQSAITSGFYADVDAGFSTLVRTTGNGAVVVNPLFARRLLDVFSARCAVLPLDQEQQRWLLRTFEHRVLDTLPEVDRGTGEHTTPAEEEPSRGPAQMPSAPPRLVPLRLPRTTARITNWNLKQTPHGERVPTVGGESAAAPSEAPDPPVIAAPVSSRPHPAEPDPPAAAAPEEPEAYIGDAPEDPPPHRGAGSRRLDWHALGLGGAAVTMTVVVVAGLVFLGSTAPQLLPVPRSEAPMIAAEVPTIATAPPGETLAPEPVSKSAAPRAEDSDSASSSRNPSDTRLAQQTRYLLQRGDRALAEQRLTEPFEDSAAANYLAVLAIERGNAQATRGLERIVDQYVGMARFELSRKKPGLAGEYLRRAQSVQPESKTLEKLAREIDRANGTRRR